MTTYSRQEIKGHAKRYGIETKYFHDGQEKGIAFLGIKTTNYQEAMDLIIKVKKSFEYAAQSNLNRAFDRIGVVYNP